MANPLKIAPPPPRPRAIDRAVEPEASPTLVPVAASSPRAVTPKFDQVREGDRVQFNKRVTRQVADGFELLAIRTRRKVPELLGEALALLEERYGKV